MKSMNKFKQCHILRLKIVFGSYELFDGSLKPVENLISCFTFPSQCHLKRQRARWIDFSLGLNSNSEPGSSCEYWQPRNANIRDIIVPCWWVVWHLVIHVTAGVTSSTFDPQGPKLQYLNYSVTRLTQPLHIHRGYRGIYPHPHLHPPYIRYLQWTQSQGWQQSTITIVLHLFRLVSKSTHNTAIQTLW